MGKEAFSRHPNVVQMADEILGYSVEDLCLRGPADRLNDTRYTQPALYVVNALTYMCRREEASTQPKFFLGHSLGEYNALLAAGVFTFDTGLRLVQKRGELMAMATGGGMAAVVGCDRAAASTILSGNGLDGIDIANDNGPLQVVLSGPKAELAAAETAFAAQGARFVPLNVSAAFHSRYMQPFIGSFAGSLRAETFNPPKVPVIANVSARPYGTDDVREYLSRQMREPVRWAESVRYLLGQGVDTYEEYGHGAVLTGLIAAIRQHWVVAAAAVESIAKPTCGAPSRMSVLADRLGADSFRHDYGVRRAYIAGSMYKGVASVQFVLLMARAGYMAYFGSGGLMPATIEKAIVEIQRLIEGRAFGVNLPASSDDQAGEMAIVELCLRYGVRFIEASGYVAPSRALVEFRLKGLSRNAAGGVVIGNRVLVKVSRADTADTFLQPAPEWVMASLLAERRVTLAQVELAREVPVADDICVEGDCAGRTDMASTPVLLPVVVRLRNEACQRRGYRTALRVGNSGGIGTPESAAAAFLLGADFILTGSVNQCTVEAGTSEPVKDLLESMTVQDTAYSPADDMFETGSKLQVLKKGVSFATRASRLYELWKKFESWTEIDASTRAQIECDYFECSFEDAYAAIVNSRRLQRPEEPAFIGMTPRHRMALVFKWYYARAMDLALAGEAGARANYQVWCGPALGAFNQRARGTRLEKWRDRHVDAIADMIMVGAAELLSTQSLKFAT
jgi:trans-AT polyketide synthase/acyltransferase/oxidoreductase domain-containing protein